jgi:hypothetical protein
MLRLCPLPKWTCTGTNPKLKCYTAGTDPREEQRNVNPITLTPFTLGSDHPVKSAEDVHDAILAAFVPCSGASVTAANWP